MITESNNGSFIHKEKRGYFPNTPKLEWLDDPGEDRNMRLLEPFLYVDLKGQEWLVPRGWCINGASVPRIFWIVDDPYVGEYRNSSIVHDWLCDIKITTWETCHRLFAEMMKRDGVPFLKRNVMAAAVWNWGPRWQSR